MEDENRIEYLKQKKSDLEALINKNKSSKRTTRVVYVIMIVGFILLALNFKQIHRTHYSYSTLIIMGLYMLITYFYINMKRNNRLIYIENDLIKIEEEIELLEISTTSLEQRAEKQFKLHQKELNRYYNENIRQMKGVYNIGVVSIAIGFMLIVGTIISSLANKDSVNNYIIPIMGVVSGILTSFIGALFIKMYTETVNTSVKFHDKLVYSNNLHFSNFLISKISNQEKREEAIFEVSKTIAEKNNNF